MFKSVEGSWFFHIQTFEVVLNQLLSEAWKEVVNSLGHMSEI
jgi:hypothetical protein